VSTGWAVAPLAAYDSETTSADPHTAHLVTACVVTINDGDPTPRTWLANPGIDIPAEATAVHGITTEHARAHGADPAAVADQVLTALLAAWAAGQPIVGYNIAFDLTVLDAELRRHGVCDGLPMVGPVIDPLVLDRGLDRYRRGKRTLGAACEHYGVRLDGAHDATADALAAARVAWRIAQRHPDVAALDLDALTALQTRMHLAWAENFQAHLASKGSTEIIDTAWPLRAAVPATA